MCCFDCARPIARLLIHTAAASPSLPINNNNNNNSSSRGSYKNNTTTTTTTTAKNTNERKRKKETHNEKSSSIWLALANRKSKSIDRATESIAFGPDQICACVCFGRFLFLIWICFCVIMNKKRRKRMQTQMAASWLRFARVNSLMSMCDVMVDSRGLVFVVH